ncbi:MAG: FAD-dependent oxidoreductase [Gemmataceae bacterium]
MKTDCCIVGGGPGGMFLALLLARQGVQVRLLESHHDFDRDFRGDTIHPPTLELINDLGLMPQLQALPHGRLTQFRIHSPRDTITIADLGCLPVRFPYIMMLPQASLLDLLATQTKRYPNLQIELGAQVNQLVRDQHGVQGVIYRQDNADKELRATLTVAADGRFSKVRKLLGLEPLKTSPPMDVVWFRLPRLATDPMDQGIVADQGRLMVLLERAHEWQFGFVIPKGGFHQLRSQGLPALHREITALVPWLADRVAQLDNWQHLTLLAVESNRLPKWYLPGLLLIGDAAHAMSPVGGVGINYAVQDAVATANLLAEPLRQGKVTVADLARVQARRETPVRMIQAFQGLMQRALIARALDRGRPFSLPLALRLLLATPILRELPARLIGLGFGRERAHRPRSRI